MARFHHHCFVVFRSKVIHNGLADAFKSCLIEGYERAVESGLRPRDALRIVLTWAADENCRLDPSASLPPA